MDLIMKSLANWFGNDRMLNRNELEELGLLHEDINPFHVNPLTRTLFDPSLYESRNPYDGLVDEMARRMVKYGKVSDAGIAKVKARKMINEAHRRFNARKRLIGDDKNLLPEKAYHNPADPNSLDTELKKHHFSGVHQPHPKFSPKHDIGRAKSGNYRLDEGGMPRITPENRQVRGLATGLLNTVALSTRHDDEHGEKIEGHEFHPKSDLEDQYVEEGLDDVFPHHTLFGGVIHGSASVKKRGKGGKVWDRLTLNQSTGHGTSYIPKHERAHTGGRETGYQWLRALATLHPRFWTESEKVPESTIEKYDPITKQLVGGRLYILKHYYGGLDKISDDILRSVAATPLGELLTEEKRGDKGDAPNRPGRAEGGGLRRAVSQMKQLQGLPIEKNKDIPKYGMWGEEPTEEYKAISTFNHNVRQFRMELGPSAEFENLFPKARVALAEAMYLSILDKRRAGFKQPVVSGAANLQSRFMAHFPSARPINPNEIKDIPWHEGMDRITRPKPEGGDLPREGLATTPATTPSLTKPGPRMELGPATTTGPQLTGSPPTLDDSRYQRSEESSGLAMDEAWIIIKGAIL